MARLTTLLEQALKTRYVEALVTHTTVTPHPTTKAPFQLQNPTWWNISKNEFIGFPYIPLVFLIRLPYVVDLIGEEASKENPTNEVLRSHEEGSSQIFMIDDMQFRGF